MVVQDAPRIQQVVRNLLSNAVKFSPQQGEIELRIVRQEQETLLTVWDHGTGIPADELEVVFDKFIQSSKTRSGAGGTGLGLAICREIVTVHQGRIWADNHPEGGTIFSVILPLTRTEEEAVPLTRPLV